MCATRRSDELQDSAKRQVPGLVNFVPALAYHSCLAMPAAFTQPGNHLLAEPCTAHRDEICVFLRDVNESLSERALLLSSGVHIKWTIGCVDIHAIHQTSCHICSEDHSFSPGFLYGCGKVHRTNAGLDSLHTICFIRDKWNFNKFCPLFFSTHF